MARETSKIRGLAKGVSEVVHGTLDWTLGPCAIPTSARHITNYLKEGKLYDSFAEPNWPYACGGALGSILSFALSEGATHNAAHEGNFEMLAIPAILNTLSLGYEVARGKIKKRRERRKGDTQ